MKFATIVLSASPQFTIPPKQNFLFGDPCYAFHGALDPYWSPFIGALHNAKWDHKGAHVEIVIGLKAYHCWVAGTRYGDGCFRFSWKVGSRVYSGDAGVDAGLLCILSADFPMRAGDRDLFVPFTTGPKPTEVEIRQGSWCRGRVPVCLT